MSQIVATGIGARTSLGNLSRSWERLLAGETGIRLRQPFPDIPPRPLGAIAEHPANLLDLTCEIAAETLADAGLASPLNDCGVVIGSSRGAQRQWERYLARGFPSQIESGWLTSLPNSAAVAVARWLGTSAPTLAPMAACATGIWAIAQGMSLIISGRCDRVLAGAVEAPITPLTLVGFERMRALAKTGCYPFDRRREGLVLGEGGALVLLESAAAARARQVPIYGCISGWGATGDAYHITAPNPDRQTAIAAIKQCLARAQLWPEAIDFIHAHGTSTLLNDRAEAASIRALFSPSIPAVSSTKGATGHPLGASGAIAIAFGLLALKQQVLPPCTGLQDPEFDLNFVRSARYAKVQNVLCLSFGFGGQNAALSLGIAR